MSELPDEPPPARRRAPRNGRRPRFVMPTEDHDERVGEVIEAFLDGPPSRARQAPRPRRDRDRVRSVRRRVPLDTRHDWDSALRHEDARRARYGRPASVLVIRFRTARVERGDLLAGRVGQIVREHARETDRVTRAAADRFHLLLPETEAPEAEALTARIRGACADRFVERTDEELRIMAAAVCPAHGETLMEALRSAQAAVGA